MSAPIRYTCPKIDHAIAILEELRNDNDELRQWGLSLEKELDEAKSEIVYLRRVIAGLENQIEDLVYEMRNG